jgi:hypothetical protein
MSNIIYVNDPREIYKYKKIETLPDIEFMGSNKDFSEYEIQFESPVKIPVITEVNKAFAHYFKLKQSKEAKALCIILHGHGSRGLSSTFYFAKKFAKHGIKSVLLELPFHGKRKAAGVTDGTGFFVLDSIGMLNRFRQSVIDTRTLIDFAEDGIFEKVEHIFIFGVSLGGMIASITMGTDSRIEKGIFLLAGGDIEGMFWKSIAMLPLRQYVYKIASGEEIKKAETEYERIDRLYDPLTFGQFIKPRKVLMFNGMFDYVIPKFASQKLKEAIGTAESIYLPAGHGSILVYRKFIAQKSITFLKQEDTQ